MRKPKKITDASPVTRARAIRCAVYTRKSSEEGLEQSFNSLDAQREACEAYVASQRAEGWVVLPQMYDDGGISGGTMDRPALKRLLADVAAGLVDTVVVYKVDRLTRSLGDFAKIVEVFDEANVSFVSVTQSFNTTTSMGRLTLNMLLSFAQFEREVTGERIRDKIAASKARGMWMGGRVPLGYEVRERKLEIVEAEAETVRSIFRRYLELGSVLDLRDELRATGIRGKAAKGSDEAPSLDRGALYHLLQNRLYRGEIAHKGKIHPGQHGRIVDQDLWDRVQALLADNRVERKLRSNAASASLLAGLVRDEDGVPLTPTHANKRGRRYRYYVSRDLVVAPPAEGGDEPSDRPRRGASRRIPAIDLEAVVEDRLAALLRDANAVDGIVASRVASIEERRRRIERAGDLGAKWHSLPRPEKIAILHRLVAGITLGSSSLQIAVDPAGLSEVAGTTGEDLMKLSTEPRGEEPVSEVDAVVFSVPVNLKRVGMEMKLLVEAPDLQRSRKPDRSLLRLLGRARHYRDRLLDGDGKAIGELAEAEGVGSPYFTRILRLAFLAPGVTEAILDGRQPIELSAKKLAMTADLPADWDEQRRALGLR